MMSGRHPFPSDFFCGRGAILLGIQKVTAVEDKMKHVNCLLAVLFVVLSATGPALAHKVNLFAYAEEGTIFTESYFPDGRAVEKGMVLVYDSSDKRLLKGVTDTEGVFNFAIPKVDDLKIVIDAGMGHKNSFTLKKAEVEAGK
jgi:nickel transport protein